MKLNKEIKFVDVRLLDTQIDLLKDALIVYIEKLQEKNNYRKVCKTKEEFLEITAARDTYMQLRYVQIKNRDKD